MCDEVTEASRDNALATLFSGRLKPAQKERIHIKNRAMNLSLVMNFSVSNVNLHPWFRSPFEQPKSIQMSFERKVNLTTIHNMEFNLLNTNFVLDASHL